MKTCCGCGVTLQSTNPEKIGFVPSGSLERDVVFCKRCFRIRHYGDIQAIQQTKEDFIPILRDLKKKKGIIVYVVDLFDLEGSIIPDSVDILKNKSIIVVGNKADLFPASVKRDRLRRFVKAFVSQKGIDVLDAVVCSAEKGANIDDVVHAIEQYRNGRDAFVIGTTNVGKSTLMNRILPLLSEGVDRTITTSSYPGTTLDSIHIPLQDGKELIDTPGFLRRNLLHEWLSLEEYKRAIPQKVIHPRTYQLEVKQSLFLGGLVRVDFIEGEKQPFTVYVSNELYIHRTKLENADAIFQSQQGKLLVPPKDPKVLPMWKKTVLHFQGNERRDIVISGLGWISCGKEKAKICISVPEGILIESRGAII